MLHISDVDVACGHIRDTAELMHEVCRVFRALVSVGGITLSISDGIVVPESFSESCELFALYVLSYYPDVEITNPMAIFKKRAEDGDFNPLTAEEEARYGCRRDSFEFVCPEENPDDEDGDFFGDPDEDGISAVDEHAEFGQPYSELPDGDEFEFSAADGAGACTYESMPAYREPLDEDTFFMWKSRVMAQGRFWNMKPVVTVSELYKSISAVKLHQFLQSR